MNKTIMNIACLGLFAIGSTQAAVYHINLGGFDSNVASYTTSSLGFDVDGISGNDTVAEIGRIHTPQIIHDSTGSNAAGVTANIGGWSNHNPADGNGNGIGYANVSDAYTSTLVWGGSNQEMTIANLDPTKTYTVEIFGGLNSNGTPYSFSVNKGPAQAGTHGAWYTSAIPLTFSGVTLQAAGTSQDGHSVTNYIEIDNASSNPVFQFVRITSVPEPSSTALLGLGGLALILRRRK